jgi:hypothetical protein
MDIHQKLCVGCAELSPEGNGLFAMIQHSCALNTIKYRPKHFYARHLWYAITGFDPLKQIKELVSVNSLPHFNSIQKIKHPLDEMLYEHARQWEIKFMKRVRNFIELEEDLNSKY